MGWNPTVGEGIERGSASSGVYSRNGIDRNVCGEHTIGEVGVEGGIVISVVGLQAGLKSHGKGRMIVYLLGGPGETLALLRRETHSVRAESVGQRLGVEVTILIGRQGIDHVGLGVVEEVLGQLIRFRLLGIVLGHLSQDAFHGRLPDIEGVNIGIGPIVREDGIDIGLRVLHVADPGGCLKLDGIAGGEIGIATICRSNIERTHI